MVSDSNDRVLFSIREVVPENWTNEPGKEEAGDPASLSEVCKISVVLSKPTATDYCAPSASLIASLNASTILRCGLFSFSTKTISKHSLVEIGRAVTCSLANAL